MDGFLSFSYELFNFRTTPISFFTRTVESSPVTPATPSQVIGGCAVAAENVRRLVSKSRRYAMLIKTALEQNFEANRGHHWYYDHKVGLSLCFKGKVVVRCECSYRRIKSVYFLLCLCGKSMNGLITYLHEYGGVIPDCGEISPEDSTQQP